MKSLGFLLCFLPTLLPAQYSERYLRSSAALMAANGSQQTRSPFDVRYTAAQLDTLSATALNFRIRAVNYLWQQAYGKGTEWVEKMATTYPSEHDTAGEIYLSTLHDYTRALRHFTAYDSLTPNFDDIIGYNPVSYLKGLAWRNLGDHQKAIDSFSIAIDSLTHKHGKEWVNYKHFVSRAVSYLATKQPEKALVDLDNAATNYSQSALVSYYRGRALLDLNQIEKARTSFRDASFFIKVLRAERAGDYLEDAFNPVYEAEIDAALDQLKR